MVNLVVGWCTLMTFAGGVVTLVSRSIRRRIQVALKDVQDRLETAESTLASVRKRHIAVLVYARRLYDMMVRAQMNPPEPPEAFYDQ